MKTVDIQIISSVGGCEWTQIGVTDGKLWTSDFGIRVQSYGHEVKKRCLLGSDFVLLCSTEALFILQASVTRSSRSLSNGIRGELLHCTSPSDQWVSMLHSAARFISFTAKRQHDVMTLFSTLLEMFYLLPHILVQILQHWVLKYKTILKAKMLRWIFDSLQYKLHSNLL